MSGTKEVDWIAVLLCYRFLWQAIGLVGPVTFGIRLISGLSSRNGQIMLAATIKEKESSSDQFEYAIIYQQFNKLLIFVSKKIVSKATFNFIGEM